MSLSSSSPSDAGSWQEIASEPSIPLSEHMQGKVQVARALLHDCVRLRWQPKTVMFHKHFISYLFIIQRSQQVERRRVRLRHRARFSRELAIEVVGTL